MSPVPSLTRDQMIEVDRLMIDEAGISLVQMMENAGRALAGFIIDRHRPSKVTVFAGRGGNGGGGLVAARHLANRGIDVDIITSSPPADFVDVPAHQLWALSMTRARLVDEPSPDTDVMIDALIGYSLTGPPRGRTLRLIDAIDRSDQPVVSLDVPSGVDSTTGECPGSAVAATATLTLALPKTGLSISPNTGSLHLADISVPAALYLRLGVEVPADLFAGSQIIDLC